MALPCNRCVGRWFNSAKGHRDQKGRGRSCRPLFVSRQSTDRGGWGFVLWGMVSMVVGDARSDCSVEQTFSQRCQAWTTRVPFHHEYEACRSPRMSMPGGIFLTMGNDEDSCCITPGRSETLFYAGSRAIP